MSAARLGSMHTRPKPFVMGLPCVFGIGLLASAIGPRLPVIGADVRQNRLEQSFSSCTSPATLRAKPAVRRQAQRGAIREADDNDCSGVMTTLSRGSRAGSCTPEQSFSLKLYLTCYAKGEAPAVITGLPSEGPYGRRTTTAFLDFLSRASLLSLSCARPVTPAHSEPAVMNLRAIVHR